MTLESRRTAGILLIALPTVIYGGAFLLSQLADTESGYMSNPLRQNLFRAGHAHAGVLLVLSLILLRYVDEAELSGFFPLKPDWPAQHPSVVISVGDIKKAMKDVAIAGGEILGEPMEIPGIGQYVSFNDTEGNRVSLLQPPSGK